MTTKEKIERLENIVSKLCELYINDHLEGYGEWVKPLEIFIKEIKKENENHS